jgi:hypothetical protein
MGQLVFQATLGGAVNLIGPNIAGTVSFTLPSADGTSGQAVSTNGSGVLSFGTLGIAGGGTGQITATAAFNALAPSQTGNSGKYLTTDGTNSSWATNPLGTVTSVAATVPSFLSISGSPITTSGTLAFSLSGTALPTTSGGTGLTSFTSGGVVYASSSSALATGGALNFDGTNLSVTSPSTATTFTLADNAGRSVVLKNSLGTGGAAEVGTTTNHDFYVRAGASAGGLNSLYLQAGGVTGYQLSYAGLHTWFVGATRTMDLTSTGLGIGTSSPARKLDVRVTGTGNVANFQSDAGPNIAFTGTETSGRTYLVGEGLVTAGSFSIYDSTGSAERLVINPSGNVGIGTSSPNRLLSLYATQPVFQITNVACGNTQGTLQYQASGGTDFVLDNQGSGSGGNIIFQQAGSERARIDSSGNLLVGTTSTITVGKQTISYNGAVNGLIISESANTSNTTFLGFNNGSTVIGAVSRVGATSAVAYSTTSDYRLKTVTGTVTGQGERIDALKPIDYLWTEGGQQARGFLAHEFQTVYPNSVTGDKDALDAHGNPKYQAMQASTAEVIADLVAEIQSLRARVAQLETN